MGRSVSIENLSFAYRGNLQPALNQVDGRVPAGTSVVLMGHGGSGKSTLACSLNSLVPRFFRGQYSGRVLVGDREVAKRPVTEMSRLVGLVLQDFEAQLFSTNVELEMAFGPENHGVPRPEIEDRITRYLALVGLGRLRRREPATLSGGQKQRLAIGSVLALETDVLVMDEPTTDLDPQARQDVLSVAKRLRETGRTTLVIDHEPETAVDADSLWLMRNGEIVSQGPPSEILRNVAGMEACGVKPHPLVALFQQMEWPGAPLTVEAAMTLIEENALVRRKDSFVPPAPPAASEGSSLLRTEGLGYRYPAHEVEALRGIDLSVREGEFVAILGQNGSGKTTLAKHFNGLLKPASGRVLVLNKPAGGYRHRDLARLVGYVFQNPDHQIFAKTVWEEVAFGLKILGEPPGVVERRASEALENVGLKGYEERVPFTLTKGERQQVAVASVLAARPRVIILDEPTTGLDYRHQRSMMEMLVRLNRAGHTIIIITHSMWVATEYATRTVVMKEGSVLLDGPTRSVFAEEVRLAEAALHPSLLVKLGNRLGTQAMTVPRMVEELRRVREPNRA